jgi:hypothetical protein
MYLKLVLSLLEACFDLISSSSLSMTIQIMGGKITENLGFKSPLRKVKVFLFFSTNQVWTKIAIRSYAWSFADSDPSSVKVKVLRLPFKIVSTL